MNRKCFENAVFAHFLSGEYKGVLQVTLHCTVSKPANCHSPQEITYSIDGAEDFNTLLEIVDILESSHDVTFTINN